MFCSTCLIVWYRSEKRFGEARRVDAGVLGQPPAIAMAGDPIVEL